VSAIREQWREWRTHAAEFRHLVRTYAPPKVLIGFLADKFSNPATLRAYADSQGDFLAVSRTLDLSDDWFTSNVPRWLDLFREYGLADRADLKILEIGSWEGLSSYFFLHALPSARIICVDTWEGADEHKWSKGEKQTALRRIETAFDANMSRFAGRFEKQKGTSYSYFDRNPIRNQFDVVYVDGSHHCDDVIVDAIKAFEQVKVGGLVIFDDYLWRFYPRPLDNPASAINAFLRVKIGDYRIVRVCSQLVIQKTADRY
jgi:predicted O-methyltransferase YrrM